MERPLPAVELATPVTPVTSEAMDETDVPSRGDAPAGIGSTTVTSGSGGTEGSNITPGQQTSPPSGARPPSAPGGAGGFEPAPPAAPTVPTGRAPASSSQRSEAAGSSNGSRGVFPEQEAARCYEDEPPPVGGAAPMRMVLPQGAPRNAQPFHFGPSAQHDRAHLVGPGLVLREGMERNRRGDMCTQQDLTCPWCGDTMAHPGTGLAQQHGQPPSGVIFHDCTDFGFGPEPLLPCQHPPPMGECGSAPFMPTPRAVHPMAPGRAEGVPYILMEGPLTPRREVPPLQLTGIPSGQPIHQRAQQPIQQPAQPTTMRTTQQQFTPIPTEGRRGAISQPGSVHATLLVRAESCGRSASCGSGDAPNPQDSSGARPPDDVRLIKSLVRELMAAADRVRAAVDRMAPPPNPPSGHASSDAELATYVRERLNRMTGARRTAAVQEIRAVLDDIGGQHAESG